MKLRGFILSLFLCGQTFAATYIIDPAHTGVQFKIKHLMVSNVSGRFEGFEGAFDFDEKSGKLEKVTTKINIDTIDTNEKKRDTHLKSPDFFGVRDAKNNLVSKNQYMTFTSKKVEMSGDKPTKVVGDLSMNGITKEVSLNVVYNGAAKDPWGNERIGFEATTELKRKDFNLTWNKNLDAGGVVVGDDVKVIIEGEAIKKK
ncbi:MAG: YceI family protein [Pseudomonadota bacterium]|nr:YceI family protein [Pseudomonadota bacterium]